MAGIGIPEFSGTRQHVLLDLVELGNDGCRQSLHRHKRFSRLAGNIAACQRNGILGNIFRANLNAQRHAAHLPIIKLKAGRKPFAQIRNHTHAGISQHAAHTLARSQHRCLLFFTFINGHNHRLMRRQPRRQHEALVIAMRHHNCANEAR